MRQFLIFVFLLGMRLEAADLHAILFIDSLAENIETAMKLNGKRWKENLRYIAQFTELELKEHIFLGCELTSDFMIPFFQSISVGQDDVVIFYFCGHGYRNLKKKDPWPYLCFAGPRIAVDFSEITELLLEKKPRLLLSMADCCNNFLEMFSPEVQEQAYAPKLTEVVEENYKKLFIDTKGALIISSSQPGEYSWAWVHRGSCFTLAFFDVLKKEVKKKEGTDWPVILELSGRRVKDLQTPQYLIID